MSISELVRGGNFVLNEVLICLKNADYLVRVFLSLSWLVWALPYFSCARWEQICALSQGGAVSRARHHPTPQDWAELPTTGNCSNSWPTTHLCQLWVSIVQVKSFLVFCWVSGYQQSFVLCLFTEHWWFTSTNKKYFVSVRTIETMSIIALRLFMIASWTSEIHHLGNHLAVVVQDDCLVLYEHCLCW